MRKKVYLVKNGMRNGKQEWKQMEGKEFYQFLQSAEGKGRCFIRLVDDISYETDDIIIEASETETIEWTKEYQHHRYLIREQKDIDLLYLDDENSRLLEEEVVSLFPTLEETYIEREEIERLRNAVALLDSEEYAIVQALYLSVKPIGLTQLAKKLKMPISTLQYRREKILKKLKFDS